MFVPIGFYYCLVHKCTHGKLFIGMYGVLATYFSCVMIRLMLVLAPAVCILAAIAISEIMRKASKSIRIYLTQGFEESDAAIWDDDNRSKFKVKKETEEKPSSDETKKSKKASKSSKVAETATIGDKKEKKKKSRLSFDSSILILIFMIFTLQSYVFHSTMLGSEAYSSPSIILSGRRGDGSRYIIDDFREAYYWMKQNTPKDAKIMSWWDYGYQITGMSNRTVLVDNNTWNNTHIATVGRAMASPEEDAIKISRSLDANYVLVIFGGMANYSGDDISKFLWMVRIAAGVFP